MKPVRYWLPLISGKKPVFQTPRSETKLKSTEIAKFLCLRCRCLGARGKVSRVSFSGLVVPIYAAALANTSGRAARISQSWLTRSACLPAPQSEYETGVLISPGRGGARPRIRAPYGPHSERIVRRRNRPPPVSSRTTRLDCPWGES